MQQKKVEYIFAGILLIGALASLYLFNPDKTVIFLPCPVHFLTGYHCPGCGSLRAIHSLLHGHVGVAMSLNPLMVVSIPIIGSMFLNPIWVYKKHVPWVAFWILIVYGVVRNIPMWPFCLLAP